MSHHTDYLTRLCDAALLRGLPADLKESVDWCLARGLRPAKVMELVRGKYGAGTMTALAVEAYIERRDRLAAPEDCGELWRDVGGEG